MFMAEFIKECKIILKSITYYVLSICIVGFIIFQMGPFNLAEPNPNNPKTFGYVTADEADIKDIMKKETQELEMYYKDNLFYTYPVGFAKSVVLDDEKKEKMQDVINEIKDPNISYDEFLNKMDEADEILGGSSMFKSERIKKSSVGATYEQALVSYNEILNDDHVSGAIARNFSDYAGIIMGIMPVFLAVSVCLRDKKSKCEEVIYSSKSSSASIVLARYLSVVLMLMIPVIIVAFFEDTQCIYFALGKGVAPDYLAFSKCILGWILPEVMISTAVGFLFTELTKGVWGIFIMLIWWFVSILSNHDITGGVGLNLIPRFNGLGFRNIYLSLVNELVINRVLYASIAVIMVLCTIGIYNYRRSGRLQLHGKIFSSFKG